jgi:hypothetical protein
MAELPVLHLSLRIARWIVSEAGAAVLEGLRPLRLTLGRRRLRMVDPLQLVLIPMDRPTAPDAALPFVQHRCLRGTLVPMRVLVQHLLRRPALVPQSWIQQCRQLAVLISTVMPTGLGAHFQTPVQLALQLPLGTGSIILVAMPVGSRAHAPPAHPLWLAMETRLLDLVLLAPVVITILTHCQLTVARDFLVALGLIYTPVSPSPEHALTPTTGTDAQNGLKWIPDARYGLSVNCTPSTFTAPAESANST